MDELINCIHQVKYFLKYYPPLNNFLPFFQNIAIISVHRISKPSNNFTI